MQLNGYIRELVKKVRRSKGWRIVRQKFIKENPTCAVCGKRHFLQVHHIEDFSTTPSLELDPTNLITLCSKHHLLFGHLGYWKSINPNVEIDSYIFNIKMRTRRGTKVDGNVGCAFELRKARNKKPYFVLKAINGEIVATSEIYSSKQAALQGILAVKISAGLANTIIK